MEPPDLEEILRRRVTETVDGVRPGMNPLLEVEYVEEVAFDGVRRVLLIVLWYGDWLCEGFAGSGDC